jgi:biopolymer transport protein TolR
MRPRRLMNQINVVPYIDVMLVLLVIFMVTAPMIQTGSVDLPTVAGVPQPPAEALRVFVKADGTLAFRAAGETVERAVTETELQRVLHDALALDPSRSVVVAADKSVRYEKVMDTLSGLRGAGVQRVGLETQSGAGAP